MPTGERNKIDEVRGSKLELDKPNGSKVELLLLPLKQNGQT